MARFPHREGAGRELGHGLRALRLFDPVVLAVSPGAVPVAAAVARVLSAPLDVADSAAVRSVRPRVPLAGRTAVVVDQGLLRARDAEAEADRATARGAFRLVLAVPVAAALELDDLGGCFDDLVCLEVGGVATRLEDWYDELPPVTEDAVVEVVARADEDRAHVVDHRVAAAPRHPATARRLRRRFA